MHTFSANDVFFFFKIHFKRYFYLWRDEDAEKNENKTFEDNEQTTKNIDDKQFEIAFFLHSFFHSQDRSKVSEMCKEIFKSRKKIFSPLFQESTATTANVFLQSTPGVNGVRQSTDL